MTTTTRPNITIYTDGACSGNPGPGGYGVILRDEEGREKELSEGFKHTTNNRMELRAVIIGLEALKRPSNVRIVTDSQYVVNSIEKKWLDGWIKKGWRKADKSPVLNIDLWKRLLPQLKEHKVSFTWVRGHAGHVENERCDVLAVQASQRPPLQDDTPAE